MEKDFHHAVTYVLARNAGFDSNEADIISYSNQFVDDAIDSGFINFDNGIMYYRSTSAYKTISLRNLTNELNRMVWLPFHFLPGNENKKAPKKMEGVTIEKLLCKPDSPVARDMVKLSMKNMNQPFALHLFGITLHAFADTWAHQGFAGILHPVNRSSKIKRLNTPVHKKIRYYIARLIKRIIHFFTNEMAPLGHGTVLSNPDKPFLKWHYTNGLGEEIKRDNHKEYMEAVDRIFEVMVEFNKKYSSYMKIKRKIPDKINKQDYEKISLFLARFTSEDEDKRHKKWLRAIKDGKFSFGHEEVSYIPEGDGSWMQQALGKYKSKDKDCDIYDLTPDFLGSNWKLFRDAVWIHRHKILYEILIQYSIYIL